MKCQFVIFLIVTISVVIKCGVIKRHQHEDAAGLTPDQEIKNTTGTHHMTKNDTETEDEELQESGDKRLKVPDAARKLSTRQELSQNNSKNIQTDTGNAKDATTTTQAQDQPVASVDVIDEDITRASQEVAEISRLIGKPLTDSHALAMLKGILLEKIHTKLEDTKDISASSKSTEEGVNKFVAALAASKKKKGGRIEEKDDSHLESHQKSDTHKQPEAKENTNCKDLEPTSRCEYLKSMGVCNDKGHGEVKVRCQLTCGACPDCSSCTTVDCGTICIGYDVQAVPPPAPSPYPAPVPAPIAPPVPPPAPVPPAPVPPAPVPPPDVPPGAPVVLPAAPPAVRVAPIPPPAPVLPVPVTPAPVLPVTTPHPHVEVAHVAEPHVHDAAGHAVGTTSAPLVHVHPSAPAPLPTTLQHLVEPVTAAKVVSSPPCEPIAPTVAHTITPPVVPPPPCKPVKPTCPPCKPEAPTCQPCEPLVPACPPPKPKPVVVAPPPPKSPPCVPVASAKPVVVHPTAQTAETWHHHRHHPHVVATAVAVPVVGTTAKPLVVAKPTTPVVHVDVSAALPVEAKPAVSPVVINPVHKPHPTLASAPVAVAAPDPAPVAVAAPDPAPVAVAAPDPAPVAVAAPAPTPVVVAAPAAGTCCSADVQKCGNPVDIGIALDSSAGVRGRWSYMKNFALSMVDRFQMGNHARFGIVQFDTIAKFPVRMETYNDAETLKVHIKKLLMNPYGKRRTDEALKVARDDLFRTARAGVRRAMIIVTNGRANGDDPTINWSQLIVEPARELQEAGVEVFVIGVTSHVAPDELKIMATDPSTQHVFQVPTFDRIQTVVDPIATRICHGWVSVVNALADGVQLSLGGSLLPPGTESLLRPTGPYGCKVKYAKMGCYSDDGNSPRPLPEELFTDQNPTSAMFTGHHVDYENWDQYLPSLVCRCAELTFQKGYKVFGLQLFGSCWSGAQAGQTYAIDGEADQDMCVSFGFKTCTPADQVCVGKQQTNFVYTFDDEGR